MSDTNEIVEIINQGIINDVISDATEANAKEDNEESQNDTSFKVPDINAQEVFDNIAIDTPEKNQDETSTDVVQNNIDVPKENQVKVAGQEGEDKLAYDLFNEFRSFLATNTDIIEDTKKN